MSAGSQESNGNPTRWREFIPKAFYATATIFAIIASILTILGVQPLWLAVLIVMVIVLSVVLGLIFYYYRGKWSEMKTKRDAALGKLHRIETENQHLTKRVTDLEAERERLIGETGDFTGEVESLRLGLEESRQANELQKEELQNTRADLDDVSRRYKANLEKFEALVANRDIEEKNIALKQEELELEREKLDREEEKRSIERRASVRPLFVPTAKNETDESGERRTIVTIENKGKNLARTIRMDFIWKKKRGAKRILRQNTFHEFVWEVGETKNYVAGKEAEVPEAGHLALEMTFQNWYEEAEESGFYWGATAGKNFWGK